MRAERRAAWSRRGLCHADAVDGATGSGRCALETSRMIQTGSNAQAALSARLFSFVYTTINNWLFVPQKFRQLADDMIE